MATTFLTRTRACDFSRSDNKILDNAWKGVEAMQLFIEAHEKLYAGQVIIPNQKNNEIRSRGDADMKRATALENRSTKLYTSGMCHDGEARDGSREPEH